MVVLLFDFWLCVLCVQELVSFSYFFVVFVLVVAGRFGVVVDG